MYDKTSNLESINEAQNEMFCQKNRTMSLESIPQNEDAFLQHCKRVIYQAGVWSISDMANVRIPSPQDFGWMKTRNGPLCG